MISKVSIRNFKSLRDVQVDLERFTVFVGPNGSGKTSFLEGLDLLCRSFGRSPNIENEYRTFQTFGAKDPVELSCFNEGIYYRYRTASPPTSPHSQQWSGEGAAFARDAQPLEWKQWGTARGDNLPLLPQTLGLRLEPTRLRQAGSHTPDPRLMTPNGSGMHSALASMALENPDEWQKLQDDLRRIVPSIQRLRHTPQSELLFDTTNGKGLKSTQVSEGTLLTLGLLAAIHGVTRPGLLLLDDADRGLHPKAQRELIELLRGVQATNTDTQIVAATHSPYLLDRMEPGEVRITYLREDGSSACEPITRHPSFGKWKDEFHAGEMWSFFGEKWVAGAEAATQ
jgi:predicted ATPase